MKLATIEIAGMQRVAGSLDGETLFDLVRLSEDFSIGPKGFPATMIDLFESGQMMDAFVEACEKAIPSAAGAPYAYAAADVTWCAPVPKPSKVVCVNSNRPTSNVEQMEPQYGGGWPRAIFFLKAPSAISANKGTLEVFSEMNSKIQPEGEPAVVIGKRATRVKAEDAMQYVAGLSLMNDVSASLFGLQDAVVMMIPGKDGAKEKFINRAMARSKGVDTFAPFGPFIVPIKDIGNPEDVRVTTRIYHTDGTVDTIQDGTIGEQRFPIGEIIETITRNMTLEPGDVIAMGAPNMAPGYYLRRGDLGQEDGGRIELEGTGIGTLSSNIRVRSLAALAAE
ncbi:fumarylacetoacetate hydrolase family protein [Martelella sp. HB161492]|uniref:fumarylacetoacetate hydrolase family protein n=1 Tax=Martelella sp. HB161492 TaxID=2720726 RepID=UPI00159173E6|nr:fumarylacetoacetate hydrolase family protein [Martelella sp. HB161492]